MANMKATEDKIGEVSRGWIMHDFVVKSLGFIFVKYDGKSLEAFEQESDIEIEQKMAYKGSGVDAEYQ